MRKFLILFCTCVIAISGYAQENWLFSPNLGLNLIPIDEGGVSGVNYKAGASFGFSAHQIVEEKWIINYGISFNRRYAAYNFSEESTELQELLDFGGIELPGLNLTVYESTEALSSFWTFDVPITTTFKFNSGLILYGGGYINFLIANENDEEFTRHVPVFEVVDPSTLPIDPAIFELLPQNETYTLTNTSKSEMESFGYGALIGFGYQSESWLLKFGYQYGFSDIRSDTKDININIRQQRAFSVSIGYLLKDLFVSSKDKAIYDLELIE